MKQVVKRLYLHLLPLAFSYPRSILLVVGLRLPSRRVPGRRDVLPARRGDILEYGRNQDRVSLYSEQMIRLAATPSPGKVLLLPQLVHTGEEEVDGYILVADDSP